MCGGILGGGAPSQASQPPVQTVDEAKEERDLEEADAKTKARVAAANATGRRSLLNPNTGSLGVVANMDGVNTNSLF